MAGIFAILESSGDDLEVEMLNDSDYVRDPDGSVMLFETAEEAASYAQIHCAEEYEVIVY